MSTRYHRLARETPAYAWWKLPVAGLLAIVIWFGGGMVLLIVAMAAIAVGSGRDEFDAWLNAAGDLDLQHLDFFVLDMLTLAIMIPAVLVAVLVTGPRPIGYLSSVAGRLRWALAGPHLPDRVRGVPRDDRWLARDHRDDGSRRDQFARGQYAGDRRDRAHPADHAVPGGRRGVRLPWLRPAARRLVDPVRDHPRHRLGPAFVVRPHVRVLGAGRRRHLRPHRRGAGRSAPAAWRPVSRHIPPTTSCCSCSTRSACSRRPMTVAQVRWTSSRRSSRASCSWCGSTGSLAVGACNARGHRSPTTATSGADVAAAPIRLLVAAGAAGSAAAVVSRSAAAVVSRPAAGSRPATAGLAAAIAVARATAPAPVPAAPSLHPDTPDYPGELPPGWGSPPR